MREDFQFRMPTQIIFGQDCLGAIGSKIQPYGRRALIVAGAMAKNSGALQTVVTHLEKAGLECILYDRVGAQPRIGEIEEGARVGRDEKCDVVVGIGGGSIVSVGAALLLFAVARLAATSAGRRFYGS